MRYIVDIEASPGPGLARGEMVRAGLARATGNETWIVVDTESTDPINVVARYNNIAQAERRAATLNKRDRETKDVALSGAARRTMRGQ